MSTKPDQLKSLLSFLASCSCCTSKKHVITIHHGSGETEKFYINGGSEGEDNSNKWKSFPPASLPIDIMSFNQVRAEASRSLKWFINDPVPFPSPNSQCICSVPSFWLAPVDPYSLPRSRQAVLAAHGEVSTVRLQDVLPWSRMRPLKNNPGQAVALGSKAHHKALLIMIIEVARSLIGSSNAVEELNMDVATMMEAEALRDGHLDEVPDKAIEETEVERNPDVEGGFLTEGGRDLLDEGGMDLDETMEQDYEMISSGLARAVFDDWDDFEEQQEVSPRQQKSPSPHHQAQSPHQQQSPSQDQHASQPTTDLIRGVPSSHIHPVLEQYCENTEQNIQYLATYLQ